MQKIIMIESAEMIRERMLRNYISFFLPRLSSSVDDDFLKFYDFQIRKYFSCKKNNYMSLVEGDMITDLIFSVYSEIVSSPFIKSQSGKKRILSHTRIVFPLGQSDTYDEEEDKSVSF
ncbi:MAG TPA: hypothetical protein IAB12_00235 [Candidatus Ornithospirochaeta avicola]|uniref:Uncharacterized protein n=1 Tax=Candidatus Ornithospirochaeta avicola TaxID=2840896 RepID=A0A9D1PT94_9SPIO|nr:hypothetical protein [Candidatus Ornithospirochaeta avicola]